MKSKIRLNFKNKILRGSFSKVSMFCHCRTLQNKKYFREIYPPWQDKSWITKLRAMGWPRKLGKTTKENSKTKKKMTPDFKRHTVHVMSSTMEDTELTCGFSLIWLALESIHLNTLHRNRINPNTDWFWSAFSRIWTEYGEIRSMKMRARVTPNTSTFHAATISFKRDHYVDHPQLSTDLI